MAPYFSRREIDKQHHLFSVRYYIINNNKTVLKPATESESKVVYLVAKSYCGRCQDKKPWIVSLIYCHLNKARHPQPYIQSPRQHNSRIKLDDINFVYGKGPPGPNWMLLILYEDLKLQLWVKCIHSPLNISRISKFNSAGQSPENLVLLPDNSGCCYYIF